MYGILPEITAIDGRSLSGFPIVIPNPEKTAVVRLPTTGEMLEWMRVQRSHYRDLGRRMGESEDVPNPAADQKLFKAIRLDNGEAFDDAEAARAIGLITRHKVVACTRSGQTYDVLLRTVFGDVLHTLRMPLEKQLMEYRRTVYVARDMPHNLEERRFPPEVPVKFYDAIVDEVIAYDGPVANQLGELQAELIIGMKTETMVDTVARTWTPPHHKRTVVAEVVSAVSALDPSLDPNW